MTLLGDLGHEIGGSIYDAIDWHCAKCKRETRCRNVYEAQMAGVEDEEALAAAAARYSEATETGPEGGYAA